MDMNTQAWDYDDVRADEMHRESRHNEFFGWCLGELREAKRLFPDRQPAYNILPAAAALMTLGPESPFVAGTFLCEAINDFVREWGWPTTISLIGSAMRELERETV